MTDKFRFAATYPVYGHMKVSFDSDLGELVSDCLWAEERGEQGSTSYWEWTGAEWSPIDVSEHVRQWGADRDAEFAEMDGGLALRPWRVWIAGPQGTKLFHSRHESEAEANAVAASLPSHLRPRVEFAPTGFRYVGVPVHRLPLAWSSTTALVQLRSWLDGLAVGTEVER